MRINLLELACSHGYASCLKDAHSRFLRRLKGDWIAPNLRTLVYVYGMKQADSGAWDTLLTRYTEEVN